MSEGSRNGSSSVSSWSIVIGGAAVLLSLAGSFWTVANPRDDIKQVKADLQIEIDKVTRAVENNRREAHETYLTLPEHHEFVIRQDARLQTLEQFQQWTRDNIVPRAEHQQVWNQQNERIGIVSSRVDKLREDSNGNYTVGDQLRQLQKEIDDLRTKTSAPAVPVVPIPTGK